MRNKVRLCRFSAQNQHTSQRPQNPPIPTPLSPVAYMPRSPLLSLKPTTPSLLGACSSLPEQLLTDPPDFLSPRSPTVSQRMPLGLTVRRLATL